LIVRFEGFYGLLKQFRSTVWETG